MKDGTLLAVDGTNAKGGILGRKILDECPRYPVGSSDIDCSHAASPNEKPFVVIGPVFSSNTVANMDPPE